MTGIQRKDSTSPRPRGTDLLNKLSRNSIRYYVITEDITWSSYGEGSLTLVSDCKMLQGKYYMLYKVGSKEILNR